MRLAFLAFSVLMFAYGCKGGGEIKLGGNTCQDAADGTSCDNGNGNCVDTVCVPLTLPQPNTCQDAANGTPCDDNNNNPGTCQNNVCEPTTTEPATCTNSSQCLSWRICSAGACADMPRGLGQCRYNNDCSSGTTCAGADATTKTLGTCTAEPASCTDSVQCGEWRICNAASTCEDMAVGPGQCRNNGDCDAATAPNCEGANEATRELGTCQAPPPCTDDTCGPWRRCNNNACADMVPGPGQCINNNNCTTSAAPHCADVDAAAKAFGTCQASPPACTHNNQCGDWLICNDDGECEEMTVGANQCKNNGDCATGLCEGANASTKTLGTCQEPTPACTNNNQCGQWLICSSGRCGEIPRGAGQCRDDNDCTAPTPNCIGADVSTKTLGTCQEPTPACTNNNQCGQWLICSSGRCGEIPRGTGQCRDDNDCTATEPNCAGANAAAKTLGTCQAATPACTDSDQCGDWRICNANGECEEMTLGANQCKNNGDCATGLCEGANASTKTLGTCQEPAPACTNNNQCGQWLICSSGRCGEIPRVAGQCRDDNDCSATEPNCREADASTKTLGTCQAGPTVCTDDACGPWRICNALDACDEMPRGPNQCRDSNDCSTAAAPHCEGANAATKTFGTCQAAPCIDDDCGPWSLCNNNSNACEDMQPGSGQCRDSNDCRAPTPTCTGANAVTKTLGTCEPEPASCTNNNQCGPWRICSGGSCQDMPWGSGQCRDSDDCDTAAPNCAGADVSTRTLGTCELLPLPPPRPPNPSNPFSDVDCDGIPDWEEIQWETDPQNRDTDGDGIWDGIEIGRSVSPDPACAAYFPSHLLSATGRTRTDPLRVDTDCDGIADGDEDRNRNGRMDPGETDPTLADTDGDGLWDGLELGLTQGLLLNGAVVAHPDPICANKTQYADICVPPASRRITDPTNPDSDGDGIPDGTEDSNRNGCFELEELDPLNPNSPHPVTEPEVGHACVSDNWVQVDIQRNLAAQIALGLPMGFQNSYVDIQRGSTHGLMGVDTSTNVAFVAWRQTNAATNLAQLRTLAEGHATTLGGTALTQVPFASWEAPGWGTPAANNNALSLTFQMAGNMSPSGRANYIANTLLVNGTGLANTGTSGNTQYIRAQYVLRADRSVIVVMAVALDDTLGSDTAFALADVAGGAALASYLDRTVVRCERGTAASGSVDFLFVVDDSNSMSSAQTALSQAATAMGAALDNSTLDWRVAMVTSSYHSISEYNYLNTSYTYWSFQNRGVVRGFTRDISEFQAWLTNGSTCQANGRCSSPASGSGGPMCNPEGSHGGCWVGINGNPTEGMLGSARLALMDMTAPTAIERIRFRPDADIVVVILTDTEDHTAGLNSAAYNHVFAVANPYWEDVQHFVDFFQGGNSLASENLPLTGTTPVSPIRPGVTIPVHAVYCPNWLSNDECKIERDNPPPTTSRIRDVVQATGGMLTPITDSTAIENTMREIVDRTIGERGIEAQRPFIGASLRVAIRNPIGACGPPPYGSNVPRSREHGFDYDGIYRTISLFGNCRPQHNSESPVAISYRAWEASDSQWPCEDDPNFDLNQPGYCTGRFMCDEVQNVCVCPALCGGCPVQYQCNTNTCECTP